MIESVICPVNGDERAERALDSAADVASLCSADLSLFSAVEDGHMVERRRAQVEDIAARRQSDGANEPIKVDIVVDPHAPRAIAERAGMGDTMVVMASSSRLLHSGYIGSAAERVAREAANPTLIVGPSCQTRLAEVERVVVPCDESQLSESALAPGREWADRLGVELWVVTVLDPGDGAGADLGTESGYVRRLANGVDANWEVLHGPDAAKTIVQWAGASLIAMTTHGRTGISRIALGSVTTSVVRWAEGPVLVSNGSLED